MPNKMTGQKMAGFFVGHSFIIINWYLTGAWLPGLSA
jgi:hypothetical protein